VRPAGADELLRSLTETARRLFGARAVARGHQPARPGPAPAGAEQDMALLSLFADQGALALASVERFSLMGRVLLDALAQAAASDDLASALRQAADHLPAAD
jgi:hypothetical protein